jgi:hypothetical protein
MDPEQQESSSVHADPLLTHPQTDGLPEDVPEQQVLLTVEQLAP